MSDKKPEKINWKEKVASSNGSMLEVPESMKEATENFKKKKDKYVAKAREFDKASAEFDFFAKSFWHEMRNALESEVNDIWSKNIGFNADAQKENINIINIVQANQGGPSGPQAMQMR